jgi:hypothetical protein
MKIITGKYRVMNYTTMFSISLDRVGKTSIRVVIMNYWIEILFKKLQK